MPLTTRELSRRSSAIARRQSGRLGPFEERQSRSSDQLGESRPSPGCSPLSGHRTRLAAGSRSKVNWGASDARALPRRGCGTLSRARDRRRREHAPTSPARLVSFGTNHEARYGPDRSDGRSSRGGAGDLARRGADQARLLGASALPASAHRPRRNPVRDSQVSDDGGWSRFAEGAADLAQRNGWPVQDR